MALPLHWQMVPRYPQTTHCVHSALGCFRMMMSNLTRLCLVRIIVCLFVPCITETVTRIQARSYSWDGTGHIHENISSILPEILVFNGGMPIFPTIFLEMLIFLPWDGNLCWLWTWSVSYLAKLGPSKLPSGIRNRFRNCNCGWCSYVTSDTSEPLKKKIANLIFPEIGRFFGKNRASSR